MTAADVESAARLLALLGYEVSPAEFRGRFERAAALSNHAFLAAASGGALAGFVHLHGTELLYERSVEVAALVVDEPWRRGGVGRALLAAAEAWARDAGYPELRIRSRLSREGPHRFFAELGYAKEKVQYTFVKQL
jgi:GNAT superfamily N-acetyltransferase